MAEKRGEPRHESFAPGTGAACECGPFTTENGPPAGAVPLRPAQWTRRAWNGACRGKSRSRCRSSTYRIMQVLPGDAQVEHRRSRIGRRSREHFASTSARQYDGFRLREILPAQLRLSHGEQERVGALPPINYHIIAGSPAARSVQATRRSRRALTLPPSVPPNRSFGSPRSGTRSIFWRQCGYCASKSCRKRSAV